MSDCLEVKRVLSNDADWQDLGVAKLRMPFDADAMAFCSRLSSALLSDPQSRIYPELIALGFWLRGANISRIAKSAIQDYPELIVKKHPRGTVFHIAPANVDTIFVYSFMLALLCGNRNIVRLSSKSTDQQTLLLKILNQCLADPDSASIAQTIAIVRYEHSDVVTAKLCEKIDVRVIWGGDDTIEAVRRIPIPPAAVEVSFANKVSLAAIGCDQWRNSSDAEKTSAAKLFAADVYQFGQKACSSPRILLWIGRPLESEEVELFWEKVRNSLDGMAIEFADINFVDKYVNVCLASVSFSTTLQPSLDNRSTRLSIDCNNLGEAIHSNLHCGSGFFFEVDLSSISELSQHISRRVQTLSYWGIPQQDLIEFIESAALNGIDRIIPFGRSLDFSYVWDGHDLLDIFTRRISLG